MNTAKKVRDVYTIVTERVISQLEKGTVPWKQPWVSAGLPQNLVSGRAYKGLNVWLLASLGYAQNLFLTLKQLQEWGGTVKEGEKPHLVVYWKWPERKEGEAEEKPNRPVLRYYMVYNIEQCEGIEKETVPPKVVHTGQRELCEKIIADMPQKPEIRYSGKDPYYSPSKDYINMPQKKLFKTEADFFETLFHETVHSTGHESRLKRKELMEITSTASDPYSIEELTAEMGTCYLSSYAGIAKDYKANAAYIKHWLEKLKNDKRFIVYAATQAQKAVDFILNLQPELQDVEEHEAHPTFVNH